MKKVVIIQRILPHYRIPFFDRLSKDLAEKNIHLSVLYGQHRENTVPKSVDVNYVWATKIHNYHFFSQKNEVIWQPCFLRSLNADLVIIEQANRLLINYLFLLARKIIKPKIALWGHGRNFQSVNPNGVLETWKRWLSKHVDWWFAYTKTSADLVKNIGFPEKKITITQNAICTEPLLEKREALTLSECEHLKFTLKINSDNVAIFCGGMYEHKNIAFLLKACKKIKAGLQDFHIIFIGEGPKAKLVRELVDSTDWVHYVGEKLGTEIVPYFAISKLMLMPGLVGLSVVDSFALKVPIVSTNIPIHSPEFGYLEDNVNARIVEYDINKYASSVINLFSDENKRSKLVEGCEKSSHQYQLSSMIHLFSNAIEKIGLRLND